MKLSTSIFSLGVFLVFYSFLYSCNTSNCRDFECRFGGCEKGICVCDTGYTGSRCDQSWAQVFSGSYTGKDCYDSDFITYNLSQVAPGVADSVYINAKIKTRIIDGKDLEIPSQPYEQDGVQLTIVGEGEMVDSVLTLRLLYEYPDFDIRCNFTLLKD